MEAIYFLQKDGENVRDVFKIGRTRNIDDRMKRPEYRNKMKCYIIYVLDDKLAETELIKIYNFNVQEINTQHANMAPKNIIYQRKNIIKHLKFLKRSV